VCLIRTSDGGINVVSLLEVWGDHQRLRCRGELVSEILRSIHLDKEQQVFLSLLNTLSIDIVGYEVFCKRHM